MFCTVRKISPVVCTMGCSLWCCLLCPLLRIWEACKQCNVGSRCVAFACEWEKGRASVSFPHCVYRRYTRTSRGAHSRQEPFRLKNVPGKAFPPSQPPVNTWGNPKKGTFALLWGSSYEDAELFLWIYFQNYSEAGNCFPRLRDYSQHGECMIKNL